MNSGCGSGGKKIDVKKELYQNKKVFLFLFREG